MLYSRLAPIQPSVYSAMPTLPESINYSHRWGDDMNFVVVMNDTSRPDYGEKEISS